MSLKLYTSEFFFIALSLSLLLGSNLLSSNLQAQENTTVLSVDFDQQKSKYSFGLCYGGYKLRGSDELVRVNESLKESSEVISDGGREGAAIEVTLDKSKAEIPSKDELQFAYLAVGAGISADFNDTDLTDIDFADYQLAFDVRIENGKTMKRSRIELHFVTSDGKGPAGDEDNEDDLLCKLIYKSTRIDKKIKLTSEFQTFKIELTDMSVDVGSVELVQEYETRGATLFVVAEDDPENFGVKGDTKLIVDNYRLIKK